MNCTDKFGAPVKLPAGTEVANLTEATGLPSGKGATIEASIRQRLD